MYTSVNHLLQQCGLFGVEISRLLSENEGKMMTRSNIDKLHNNLKPYRLKNENTMKRELKRTVIRESVIPVLEGSMPATATAVVPAPSPSPSPARPLTQTIKVSSDEKDQLFWLFYICKNGIDSYELMRMSLHRYQKEKELKFGLIDVMRENKKVLKDHRFKLPEIENELGNKDAIKLPTFLALCCVFDISIVLVMGNIYYVNPIKSSIPRKCEEAAAGAADADDDAEINWILNISNSSHHSPTYSLLDVSSMSDAEMERFSSEMVRRHKIMRLDKPINALSSYGKEALNEIADKVGVKTSVTVAADNGDSGSRKEKPRTKREVYEDILVAFSLLIPKMYE